MTLMALSLAIGHPDRRRDRRAREHRPPRRRWARTTTRRPARAPARSASPCSRPPLSTLCVFVPVAFMGGIVGQFFREFGVTVAVRGRGEPLRLLHPRPDALVGLVRPGRRGPRRPRGPLGARSSGSTTASSAWASATARVIGWALGHRMADAGHRGRVLHRGARALPAGRRHASCPVADDEELAVLVKTPVGSSLDYTRDRVREVSAAAAPPSRGRLHLRDDRRRLQRAGQRGGDLREARAQGRARPAPSRRWSRVLRARDREPARGRRSRCSTPAVSAARRSRSQIYVKGDQIDELRRISNEVLEVVRRTPGAIEAESGLEEERPEVRIDLRRDLASEMGVGVGALAATLRPALAGQKASTWEDPERRAARRDRAAAARGAASRSSSSQRCRSRRRPAIPRPGAPRIVRLGHVAIDRAAARARRRSTGAT